MSAPVDDFAARLRALRKIAGQPSFHILAALTERTEWPQSKSKIYDKLRPNSAADEEFVVAFVLACQSFAVGQGRTLPADLVDLETWRSDAAAVRREDALMRTGKGGQGIQTGHGNVQHNTFITLPPSQAAPSAEQERELLVSYLEALCAEIGILRPGAIRGAELPLELELNDVYIELQAERDQPDIDRRVTVHELAEARKRDENWTWEDKQRRERQYRISADRERSSRDGAAGHSLASLAAVVERHDQVVILGDPGSGKTTLLRHLALQSAQSLLNPTDPAAGLTRVPIYVRISAYAEFRAVANPDLPLRDYLSHYVKGLQLRSPEDVTALLYRSLDEGRGLILLDGLDEVIEDRDRANVARAIAQFAAVYRGKRVPGTEQAQGHNGPSGNKLAVTSRIAGYRPFVELPSSFGHYVISPMSRQQVEAFLGRWFLAVEKRLQPEAESELIEQQATRRKEMILDAIERSPGVARLTDNPLLLRLLAMLHRSEGNLPRRRVELYWKAANWLLYDWHLERGAPPGAAIDEQVALSLLGPVAMHIHTRRPSGLLSLGQMEELLCEIRGPQLGDPPGTPSVETIKDVTKFLRTVREHSGLLVERGTGMIGFMHLTFQEYFVARYLISRDGRIEEIRSRLHQPRWREPVLLAVAFLSDLLSGDIDRTLLMILDAGSEYEAILHRDLLFAADCASDCAVFPMRRKDIARRLIATYCDAGGAGRYALLRRQVQDALRLLSDSADSWAVEAALAEEIGECRRISALSRAAELADLLSAQTPAVIRALQEAPALLPEVRQALTMARRRALAAATGTEQPPAWRGWRDYRDDRLLAQTVGALWLFGWRDFTETGLGAPSEPVGYVTQDGVAEDEWTLATRLRQLAWYLEMRASSRRDNVPLVASELTEVIRELRFAGRSAPRHTQLADLVAKVRGWYERPGSRLSNRIVAQILDILTPQAWDFPDEDHDVSRLLLTGQVLSGVHLLRRGRQLTHGQSVRFQSAERWLANLLGPDDTTPRALAAVERTGGEGLDEYARRLADGLGQDLPGLLHEWGRAILTHAQFGDAAAAVVVGALRGACPLLAAADADGWRLVADVAGSAMIESLLRLLRATTDPRQYLEASFLLARTGRPEACEPELRTVIAADLDGESPERALSALRTLRDPVVRHVVAVPEECGRLTELAGRRPDLADAALDVLFAGELSPELLAWCLDRLRDAGPELSGAVRARLDAVRVVNGSTSVLRLIDAGLADDATRTAARGLLRKVAWVGQETYAQCMDWLRSADPDARGIAGLLLTQDERLFDVPQLALRDAIREQFQAMASPLPVSWAVLRANPDAMLLLKGLWAYGWRDALVLLWLDEPTHSYVSRSHPDIVAADPEDAVFDVLGEARFGQALIPVVLEAAGQLARLHRARGSAGSELPHVDDIQAVHRQLVQQLAEITAGPARPPSTPLEADAAILYAVLRGLPVQLPPDSALLAMLSGGEEDDAVTWFWAASRLVGVSARRAAVQDTVMAALADANPQRAGLALLILLMNPALLAVMRTTITDELRRPGLDTNRGLLIAHLLMSADPRDDIAGPWLRALVSQEYPASAEDAVRSAALLAQRMISSGRPQARAVAAAQLLAADLYALLVPVLAEAALSGNSRLRWEAQGWLFLVSSRLPTDGSTAAVDWLYRQRTSLESASRRSAEGAGRQGTILMGAVESVSHTHPYWLAKWLATYDLDGADEREFRHASVALGGIFNASDDVIDWICAGLTEPGHSEAVRRSFVWMLYSIRQESASRMADARITAAFLAALDDASAAVRRPAAWALEWTTHEVEKVTGALLRQAESDPDQQARSIALVSLGRLMRRAEALPEAAVDLLLQRMRVLVSEADAVTSRAAAGGIAAALESRDDVTARLLAYLPSRAAVLSAMLLGAADTEQWVEEPPSHHVGFIRRTAAWIHEQPELERTRLIDLLLADLERAAAGMEEDQPDDTDDARPWETRRIVVGVLAELSERLTYHSFIHSRPLAEVVALVARVAKEPDSYNARRFTLKILGNLQHFTPEVAGAFFEACGDVSPVYQDSKAVIGKFNDFTPGSFEKLTQALFDPGNDPLVAYRAAALLGVLGTARSVELGSAGRSQLGGELARFLADPLASRIAVEQVETQGVRRLQVLGPVYDAAYDALIRVVAGPDAPDFQATAPAEMVATSEVVWQQEAQGTSAELQEILEQLQPGGQPGGTRGQGPRVRVFWKEGRPASRYCISVYNHESWVGGVTYAAEDGYHKLFVRPLQDRALSSDNVIVISAENDAPDSDEPGAVILPGMLRDDPTMQLIHDDVFDAGVIIGIGAAAVQELAHATEGQTLRIYAEPPAGKTLTAADIVVGRETDFYVSFPYWDEAIERVSYTVEDERLNIIVKPSDEGLKLLKGDVQFTQGIGYAGLPAPDTGRLRRRKGRGAMQFVVSLPHSDDAVDQISYRLREDLLHIVIRTKPSFWPLNLDDIEFKVTPLPESDGTEQPDEEEDEEEPSDPGDRAHRLRVFWRVGSPAQRYDISVYNEEHWACETSYETEPGFRKLLLRPPQDPPPFGGSLVVISPEDDPLVPSDRDAVLLAEVLLEDPRVQLVYDEAFDSGVAIGISTDVLERLSQVIGGQLTHIVAEPRAGMTLNPADVVVGRENDCYVSFPHWPDSIEKVSYTIDGGRLNIIVKPGERGLKLKDSDVRFTRGIGYAGLGDPGTGKLRRRKGRGAVQFTVSLPCREGTVEKVSYKLADDFLHIIIRASESFWPLPLDDVAFQVLPLPDDHHQEEERGGESRLPAARR